MNKFTLGGIISYYFCMQWVSDLVLYFYMSKFAVVFSIQYYCSLLVQEVSTYSVRGIKMELSSQLQISVKSSVWQISFAFYHLKF